MNGRPLTFVGVDAKDPEVLTPNHLLLGRNLPNTAPFIPHDSDVNSRRQYKRLQAVTEQFWRRWMRENLPTLHQRSRWHDSPKNVNVGDIVLLIDANTPRGKWPLGRVTFLCHGTDGIVRSVTVKTETTELERPVVKLCILDRENSNDNASTDP